MKGKRNASIKKHTAVWGSNAVVCVKSDIESGLEVNRMGVGRLAQEPIVKKTNEPVQGVMGCASFEVREEQSKICFEERLGNTDDQGWVARLLRYLYIKSVDKQQSKRARRLRTKYMKPGSAWEATKKIKIKAKESERTTLKQRMDAKKSFDV